MVLVGVMFIPGTFLRRKHWWTQCTKERLTESPRFLVWKGQRELAWNILKRLHHDPRNASDTDAEAEFTQIVRQVEVDKEDEPTFYKIFKKPTWRRRAILVFFLL